MTSFLLYLVGGILVLAGIALLFWRTGLADLVPSGIALAAFLVLVGLVVIGLSSRAPRSGRKQGTDRRRRSPER